MPRRPSTLWPGEQAGFPSSPGSGGLREVWVGAAGPQPRHLNGCPSAPSGRWGGSVLPWIRESPWEDGGSHWAQRMQVVILPGRPEAQSANTRQSRRISSSQGVRADRSQAQAAASAAWGGVRGWGRYCQPPSCSHAEGGDATGIWRERGSQAEKACIPGIGCEAEKGNRNAELLCSHPYRAQRIRRWHLCCVTGATKFREAQSCAAW